MNFLSGAEIKCPLFVLERVRIMEGFLMKIHGILSWDWKLSVIEVSVLQRFDCTAIQFLLIFLVFFFLWLFLGIGQTQSIDNIFKEFFPFFSSHGNLCTTMSESWLVELMQSVGMVHECLNAFFLYPVDWTRLRKTQVSCHNPGSNKAFCWRVA